MLVAAVCDILMPQKLLNRYVHYLFDIHWCLYEESVNGLSHKNTDACIHTYNMCSHVFVATLEALESAFLLTVWPDKNTKSEKDKTQVGDRRTRPSVLLSPRHRMTLI